MFPTKHNIGLGDIDWNGIIGVETFEHEHFFMR